MKKYCIKFTAFVLALCIPLAAFFFYVQSLPYIYEQGLMGILHYKIHLIETTPSPRIILVGGSSSPYGTVCKDFAQAFDMPCINVGVTAYFGLDYYISMLNKYTRKGDIVILAPENISMRDKNVDYTTLWNGIESDAKALELLPPHYYPGMVFSFLKYAKAKLPSARTGAAALSNVYHASFGPLGDVTMERSGILESKYNRDDIITLSADIVYDGAIRSLNRYAKKAQKKGVQVFFAFAPLDELAVPSTGEDIAAYGAEIKARLTMPVIGTVEEHMYKGEYFYDSNNHLTSEGAKINTAKLIKELKDALKKSA